MCEITGKNCKCHNAVMKTYSSLKQHDPETVAFEAACRVYQFHHPEDTLETTKLTVERWVHAGRHH